MGGLCPISLPSERHVSSVSLISSWEYRVNVGSHILSFGDLWETWRSQPIFSCPMSISEPEFVINMKYKSTIHKNSRKYCPKPWFVLLMSPLCFFLLTLLIQYISFPFLSSLTQRSPLFLPPLQGNVCVLGCWRISSTWKDNVRAWTNLSPNPVSNSWTVHCHQILFQFSRKQLWCSPASPRFLGAVCEWWFMKQRLPLSGFTLLHLFYFPIYNIINLV